MGTLRVADGLYKPTRMLEDVIAYPSSVIGLAVLMAAFGAPAAARAQSDRYHITAEEKAACTMDAERLCLSSYPNEEKLLRCMMANKASLTPSCLVVFNAGLKRRRLVSR